MGVQGGITWEGACYAEEVIGLVPGAASRELGHEDVNALRGCLPSWRRSSTGKKCVVVIDEVCSETMVQEKMAPWLEQNDWTVHLLRQDELGYDSLLGASWCIIYGGPETRRRWSALWALPLDACVVEFQQELALDGELQHLCHVSDWKSWVLLLAKGSVSDVQDQVMEQLTKWYKKNSCELEHKAE